jgi:hypothetical protein
VGIFSASILKYKPSQKANLAYLKDLYFKIEIITYKHIIAQLSNCKLNFRAVGNPSEILAKT